MGCSTGIIQRSENSRRSFLLDEVAYDLVIEVLDGRPFDLFPNVFFLLGLQRQFNEDLLQLLVDIVDAKLFERVILEEPYQCMQFSMIRKPYLENLEAEDVLDETASGNEHAILQEWTHQNTHDLGSGSSGLHRYIDPGHNPLKQIVVDRLGERIPPRPSLRRI